MNDNQLKRSLHSLRSVGMTSDRFLGHPYMREWIPDQVGDDGKTVVGDDRKTVVVDDGKTVVGDDGKMERLSFAGYLRHPRLTSPSR